MMWSAVFVSGAFNKVVRKTHLAFRIFVTRDSVVIAAGEEACCWLSSWSKPACAEWHRNKFVQNSMAILKRKGHITIGSVYRRDVVPESVTLSVCRACLIDSRWEVEEHADCPQVNGCQMIIVEYRKKELVTWNQNRCLWNHAALLSVTWKWWLLNSA